MSDIKSFGSLSGSISSKQSLTGKLSLNQSLTGTISEAASLTYDMYEGDYSVIPDTKSDQIMNTSNKYLSDDIVVAAIPYHEIDNPSNGLTIYIGKEV